MHAFTPVEDSHVEVLHEIGVRLATADGFREVLSRVVHFASVLVKCDSCLIYVLEVVWLRLSGEQLGQENCNTASGRHATACFAATSCRAGSEVISSMGQVRDGVQRKEFIEAI